MGLFTKRKRASRRAEAKALKHKASLEAKYGARTDRKRLRVERRATDRVSRAQVSTLKAQEEAARKTAEKATRDRLSVGNVRKYLGVARVLMPVLIPLAYRAATFIRSRLDLRRAQQLGVSVEQLAEYSGHGAALTARIANAESSTRDILAHYNDRETTEFVATTRERLTNLDTAIRTAEHMPAPARKSAHNAIGGELTGIESELLSRLGVK